VGRQGVEAKAEGMMALARSTGRSFIGPVLGQPAPERARSDFVLGAELLLRQAECSQARAVAARASSVLVMRSRLLPEPNVGASLLVMLTTSLLTAMMAMADPAYPAGIELHWSECASGGDDWFFLRRRSRHREVLGV
jgi:hypothetical protein